MNVLHELEATGELIEKDIIRTMAIPDNTQTHTTTTFVGMQVETHNLVVLSIIAMAMCQNLNMKEEIKCKGRITVFTISTIL